jgi:acyl-CoA thioesterase YciA
MAKFKPPMREPCIRVIMRPRDLNHQGVVFGGVVLSYIDEAGFVEAKRQAYHRYVTASISQVDFKAPIHCGDVVSFYAETLRVGTTSITVQVNVYAEYVEEEHKRVPVTVAELTYVALDRNGKPTPVFGSDESAEDG